MKGLEVVLITSIFDAILKYQNLKMLRSCPISSRQKNLTNSILTQTFLQVAVGSLKCHVVAYISQVKLYLRFTHIVY